MNFKLLGRMLKLGFWLAVLFVGAWIGNQMKGDPGAVLISVAGFRIEMTVWIGLVLLLVSWVVIYTLTRLTMYWRLDQRLLSWRQGRSIKNAEANMQKGISSLARGNFKQAHQFFSKSVKSHHQTTVNLILAAFASYAQGKRKDCDQWLIKASQTEGADQVLVSLLQALVQVDSGEYEQALATLNRMPEQKKNQYRLKLLRKIYYQLGDWDNLEGVVGQLGTTISADSSSELTPADKELIIRQISEQDLVNVKQRWKALPAGNRYDRDICHSYIKRLMSLGEKRMVLETLQECLGRYWEPSLVEMFGQLDVDSSQQQIMAERWLRDHPGHPDLLVALGRLSLRNQQWDKAEDYLQTAVSINDHSMAHQELGRFYAARGQYQLSNSHFIKGLKSAGKLPELPMPTGA